MLPARSHKTQPGSRQVQIKPIVRNSIHKEVRHRPGTDKVQRDDSVILLINLVPTQDLDPMARRAKCCLREYSLQAAKARSSVVSEHTW